MSVRIVLTEPSHPGNIGAAARAMKNMCLSELYLVRPNQFPSVEATVRASGADDLLAQAVVVDTLEEALVGCEMVFGTSARDQVMNWPNCTPREAAECIAQKSDAKAAIVFGRECSGLTNEELMLTQTHIQIPTNPEFSSLNLGAAVQVLAYEIYMAARSTESAHQNTVVADPAATADDLNGFIDHLRSIMIRVKFLNPRQPKKLMSRLRHLFYRAALTKTEINILRGFLSAIDKAD